MKIEEKRSHEAKASFYAHLIIFAAVNSLLVGVNLTFSPSVLWFLFVMLGWGSGLLIHGLTAFWPLDSELEQGIKSH